ncbi:MAG: hypothetical protein ACXVKI_17575 [Flavisolibacter sp.]
MAEIRCFYQYSAKYRKMLIGRVAELKELKAVAAALTSCFVAVYGRRRVGKTFLIRQAFKNKFDFHLTGITGASLSQQLTNFHLSWLKTFPGSEERNPSENWLEALERLTAVLEKASQEKRSFFWMSFPGWMLPNPVLSTRSSISGTVGPAPAQTSS